MGESLSDGDVIGRRFPVGGVVFPSSMSSKAENPGPLWTCDGGAIGVAPFLKASHLDYRRGLDARHGFATGSRSCSSLVELGNDDRWRSFPLDPSGGDQWVPCHGKSKLLAALLPCSATMIHDSVSCLCSITSCGVVSPSDAILATRLANLLVHYYFLSS